MGAIPDTSSPYARLGSTGGLRQQRACAAVHSLAMRRLAPPLGADARALRRRAAEKATASADHQGEITSTPIGVTNAAAPAAPEPQDGTIRGGARQQLQTRRLQRSEGRRHEVGSLV